MEVIKINLQEVRMNEKNIYIEEENIKELADSILRYGQLENATVYQDESINDGKKYTLIGGHRRFLAISYLAERNYMKPFILASVVQKPELDHEENLMILADNQQREKDKETRIREIKVANDYYNYLISINQRPSGKRRVWIANMIGISERQVQDILTSLKNNNGRTLTSTSNSADHTQSSVDEEVKKMLKRAIKNIHKASRVSRSLDTNFSTELSRLEETVLNYIERLD